MRKRPERYSSEVTIGDDKKQSQADGRKIDRLKAFAGPEMRTVRPCSRFMELQREVRFAQFSLSIADTQWHRRTMAPPDPTAGEGAPSP